MKWGAKVTKQEVKYKKVRSRKEMRIRKWKVKSSRKLEVESEK